MLRTIPKSFAEKIADKRKVLGISQIDLGKKIGVSQTILSRIEQAKTRVDIQVIEKLCEVLSLDVSEALTPELLKKPESKEGYRTIPEYNVRVSAGHGEFQGIEEVKQNLQMPKLFLPENGQVGFVRVEGDSMTPTIAHGDYVAVEFDSGYTSDGLYLIRIDDAVFVKRLQRKFGGVRIISDNHQYEEMTVSPDDGNDFGLIGRVALVIRKT